MAALRKNVLGDIRAEEDGEMLDKAFFESPDYKSLIESNETPVVVGRRGTGKSAIAYNLKKHFSATDRTKVIYITPEEDQIIGLRPLLELVGTKFSHVKRTAWMGWKYAVYLQIAEVLMPHYKARSEASPLLDQHLLQWRLLRGTLTQKLRSFLKTKLAVQATPEERISSLAHGLDLREIEDALNGLLSRTHTNVVILVDQVDEGYEPDEVGIALVDGIVQATIDINDHLKNGRSTVFLRDNIFRALAVKDPDYSRNIEGQVLRLHWDDYQLFSMVCNRIRTAFDQQAEKDQKVWNQVTSQNVRGLEGFRKCLQFTLYRPRDILLLLNTAFFHASRENRSTLVDKDVEFTAKAISSSRLDDLKKEYTAIFPSLPVVTSRYESCSPELSVKDAIARLENIRDVVSVEPQIQQDLEILKDPLDIIRNLYSIGFFGLHDNVQNNFAFCHDGKTPTKEFTEDDRLLIHPCYWMALNLTRNALNPDEAEVIYDEYELRVSSDTPVIRSKRLGRLKDALDRIPMGHPGAHDFEDWCLEAIRIIFAGALSNIQLHPNKMGKQHRDVVATNLSKTSVWKRVLEDYKSRQVVFEVKNFSGIAGEEYRQVVSYISGPYGTMGFIITRDETENLVKGGDLDWMRVMYFEKHVLIVKITGKWIAKLLSKLRSPQKHDVADRFLNGLLDQYHRLYLTH